MRQLCLIVHNVRSCHNVGSILRTTEGLGIQKVYLTGYTPYPTTKNDHRLPYLSDKITNQIHKTALGAEQHITWHYIQAINPLINNLKKSGYTVAALEQHPKAVKLINYRPPNKLALIVGREVDGIETDILKSCDVIIEIPMRGHKESFNVAVAAAMALYHLSINPEII